MLPCSYLSIHLTLFIQAYVILTTSRALPSRMGQSGSASVLALEFAPKTSTGRHSGSIIIRRQNHLSWLLSLHSSRNSLLYHLLPGVTAVLNKLHHTKCHPAMSEGESVFRCSAWPRWKVGVKRSPDLERGEINGAHLSKCVSLFFEAFFVLHRIVLENSDWSS